MRVPRQPNRYSGRTAMSAAVSVHEPKATVDDESPLAFSMEGHRLHDPGALLPYTWAPGWNSNQSIYKFQAEVGGELRGGPAGIRLPTETLESAVPPAGRPSLPEAFRPGAGFLIVPLQEVFGGEELSARTPAIRQRMPVPYAVLSPEDARRLGVGPGDGVRLGADGNGQSFMARIEPAMCPGAVGVVQGMTGAGWSLPGSLIEVTADPAWVPPARGVIARG
jgi:NADH-quinone oxidoreductase subunit G